MTKHDKLLDEIVAGRSDHNVNFTALRSLLGSLGFHERIRGDHHIFSRTGVVEILNLQPLPGGKAKGYQVRQVRNIVVRYKLAEIENED
ncbi:MAG TPA: type II toxin-antitoxin system HicA family toxin [Thermoanaerobaculia bacterium]|nr:type II toxin-antitoxin system HicA family toxin [Thermoanaerobaculia bacterium]